MNKTPSILVDTGFEVDQNGMLTEIVFPEVVTTSQMPTKVTFLGQNFNWNPSNTSTLIEFSAPNMVEVTTSLLKGFTALTTVSFDSLTSVSISGANNGMLSGCTALTSVNMPKLQTYTVAGGGANISLFGYCTSLVSVTLPELLSISEEVNGAYGGMFFKCTALTTVNLPKLQVLSPTATAASNYTYGDTFSGCTSLTSVTLGSEGHPVSSIQRYPFYGLTQSNLTITIYTTDGAALSGQPWGATNATIVYEEA